MREPVVQIEPSAGAPRRTGGGAPALPAWVTSRVGPVGRSPGGVSVARGSGLLLVSATLDEAAAMPVLELRAGVAEVYAALRAAVGASCHVVRAWNFIPGIHDPMGDGLSRYHVFNLGRFEAFTAWQGEPATLGGMLPTATGVGHDGADLTVHLLATPEPGVPVENPRQRPAFRYSRQHGPRPPCFARATRTTLAGVPTLLVGGTASVRGEDSVHAGSLADQLTETFENLAAVLAAGGCRGGLATLTSARVYHVGARDAALTGAVRERLPGTELEFVRADICRPELLVEIEGIAGVGGP